jgi:AAA+ superfamily predicted ATPase
MNYQHLILQLEEFCKKRLSHYFGQEESEPAVNEFHLEYEKEHPFYDFIRKHSLSSQEQIILGAVLVPHLNPEFYSRLILSFLPNGGDLPVFGCVKGKQHRGFLPTGETIQFILGGTHTENRLKTAALLKSSSLLKKGVLLLEPPPPGEPELSGKLILSKEYAGLFLTGELTTPEFGPDFPAQKIETSRSWDDLVLPDELEEKIGELKTWMLHNETLMEKWGMREKVKPGYRVLFYGPSGTGKTLTATLLGKYTGREVFRVDLSTIVSKYIGETEKNLEKLFTKASNKDWILFFDEADALFGKRTEVSDSHDRYANQEVSYLLQRVETFNGMVILSSNYKTNIDDAFLRRFNAILKFTLPDSNERLRIWKRSLPDKMKREKDLDLWEVARRYKLTGGNIMNVVHWAALRTVSLKSDTITLESLLLGIKREVEKEGKIFSNLFEERLSLNGKSEEVR